MEINKNEIDKNSKILKIYLKIGLNSIGHYKSFLINSFESFYSLKLRLLDKLNIKKVDYYYYEIRMIYNDYKKKDLIPNDNEIILKLIEREELYSDGEILIILQDIRLINNNHSNNNNIRNNYNYNDNILNNNNNNYNYNSNNNNINNNYSNNSSNNNSINRLDSTTSIPSVLETCTEFNQTIYDGIASSSVPETVLSEIESISIKIGRLQIHHSGKDPWRDVILHLTSDSLWYTNVSDPYHFLVCIPLNSKCRIQYPEDSNNIFCIPETNPTLFRTKSRVELTSWIDTINSRHLLSTENDIIFMAEEFCSIGENRKTYRDIEILSDCSSFEGTLRNGYLRENFRNFLMANFAQESLLFWEYAEDFRRGHPLASQPLISTLLPNQNNNSIENSNNNHNNNDISRVITDQVHSSLRQWALALYRCFIAESAPMQVAIPGEAKISIEKILFDENAPIDPDLFKNTQNQLFNHLKFQLFPSYVQRVNYRSTLMSVLNHKVHQCSLTKQVWSHSTLNSASLLLSSPASFYPSFFSPRLYSRTHRPYTFLSQGGGDTDILAVNSNSNNNNNTNNGLHDQNNNEEISNETPTGNTNGGWRLGQMITRFRAGAKNSNNSTVSVTKGTSTTKTLQSDLPFPIIKSGNVPTPWRESIVRDSLKPPQWLPQYWWTHIDFKSNIYFSYDDTYDSSLLKMLPRWMQAITRKKRIDGLKILPLSPKSPSSISLSLNDISIETDTQPKLLQPNGNTLRKRRSDTFVGFESNSSIQSEDSFLEYQGTAEDIVAHLSPPTSTSKVTFCSHGAGRNVLNKSPNIAISSTPLDDFDEKSDEISWQYISVPHLSKSKAYKLRLSTHPIPGPIIECTIMSTRYNGIISGASNISTVSTNYSQSVDYDRDGGYSPLDTPTPVVNSPPNFLNTDVSRIVVLSSREDGDGGELRLYDPITHHLLAIIRLSSVIHILPSSTLLHTIEIHDNTGSIWYLHPENVHPNFGTSGAKYWLSLLAQYCSSKVHTVLICHEGYLGKRGQLNTAYKRRWFVLDSEQKLLYFARWENGQSRLKGEVDVGSINDVVVNGKDLKLSTDERIWYFQADTEDDASFWQVVLSHLIPLKHGVIRAYETTDFTT